MEKLWVLFLRNYVQIILIMARRIKMTVIVMTVKMFLMMIVTMTMMVIKL